MVRAAARDRSLPLSVEMRGSIKSKWAALIAKIFRAIPTICPKCGTAMDLKEFILDEVLILRALPQTARALARRRFSGWPPQKHFEPHPVDANAIAYTLFEDKPTGDDADFNQAREYDDSYFNQDMS